MPHDDTSLSSKGSQSSWTPGEHSDSRSRFTGRLTGKSTGSTGWQPSAHDLSSASGAHPAPGGSSTSGESSRLGRLRPRYLVVMVFLAAAAAAVFAMTRTDSTTDPVAHRPLARVELSHGTVLSHGAVTTASGKSVSTGLTLAAGETLTTDADSGVALRLASGPSVRLAANSRARLTAGSELLLERGALYVDARGSTQVEIHTSLGSVRDIGTQFEVRLQSDESGSGDRLRVRVREGTVLLTPDASSEAEVATHTARVGEQLVLNSEGQVLRGTTPIHGSHWDWVVRTAPLPAVEGESLRVFLDWLGREGGWDVRYADPRVEDVARATILHGDLEALSATDAATMVLRSSGLDYRIEKNVLEVVARQDAQDAEASSP